MSQKTTAELLIITLTKDSGRNVFTTEETLQLQKIAYLEGQGDITNMNLEIEKFKSTFVLQPEEWLV